MRGNQLSSTMKRCPHSVVGLLNMGACSMTRQRACILLGYQDSTCMGRLQAREDYCQHNPIETLEHASSGVVLPMSISFFLPSPGAWVSLYFFCFGWKASRIPCKPSSQHVPLTPAEQGGPGVVKFEHRYMTCCSRQCNQEGPCTPQAERSS